jgi:hypothetical protein
MQPHSQLLQRVPRLPHRIDKRFGPHAALVHPIREARQVVQYALNLGKQLVSLLAR